MLASLVVGSGQRSNSLIILLFFMVFQNVATIERLAHRRHFRYPLVVAAFCHKILPKKFNIIYFFLLVAAASSSNATGGVPAGGSGDEDGNEKGIFRLDPMNEVQVEVGANLKSIVKSKKVAEDHNDWFIQV